MCDTSSLVSPTSSFIFYNLTIADIVWLLFGTQSINCRSYLVFYVISLASFWEGITICFCDYPPKIQQLAKQGIPSLQFWQVAYVYNPNIGSMENFNSNWLALYWLLRRGWKSPMKREFRIQGWGKMFLVLEAALSKDLQNSTSCCLSSKELHLPRNFNFKISEECENMMVFISVGTNYC